MSFILDPMSVKGFQLPYLESKLSTFISKCILYSRRAFIVRYFMLPRSNFIHRTPSFYPNKKDNNRFVSNLYKKIQKNAHLTKDDDYKK